MNDSRTLVFRRWYDAATDRFHQPPIGDFSRHAWLPTIGPTSWVLWGLVADRLMKEPSLVWRHNELAAAVGVAYSSSTRDRVVHSLARLCTYRIFTQIDPMTYAVRLTAPP